MPILPDHFRCRANRNRLDVKTSKELDLRLSQILDELSGHRSLVDAQDLAGKLCDDFTQTEGNSTNKLLFSGWREQWKLEKNITYGMFLDVPDRTGEEREYMFEAFFQLVRFVVGGTNDRFRKRFSDELSEALEDYLSLRGIGGGELSIQSAKLNSFPVQSVTIFGGEDSFIARVDDDRELAIPKENGELFRMFAAKVALGAASEWIEFSMLNALLKMSPDLPPEYHDKASPELRKAIHKLNSSFRGLGEAPNHEQYLRSRKTKGYFLNESIEWDIGEERLKRDLIRNSRSVFTLTPRDSNAIENNTPSKNQRLPSRPSRHRSIDDDTPFD